MQALWRAGLKYCLRGCHNDWRMPTARHDMPALLLATVAAALACVAWDASGLDLPLARWSGDTRGFPLRGHWLLEDVLHQGARRLAWAAELGLCWLAYRPLGPWRRLAPTQRACLAASVLACAVAVPLLKAVSPAHCPWNLADFGGSATWASHWGFAPRGGGHCFPAGHAVAGFAFVGGYFSFRPVAPVLARAWLFGALGAGLLFGLSQQLRGAHFMSHTLWSAWLCWVVAWAVHACWPKPREAHSP